MSKQKSRLSHEEEIVIRIYIFDELLLSGKDQIDLQDIDDELCDFINQSIEDPDKRIEAFEYEYMMLLKECDLV